MAKREGRPTGKERGLSARLKQQIALVDELQRQREIAAGRASYLDGRIERWRSRINIVHGVLLPRAEDPVLAAAATLLQDLIDGVI